MRSLGMFFLIAAITSMTAAGQEEFKKGKVTGTVFDQASRQPIPGANITIEGTSLGTSTAVDGRFALSDVPVGTYRMKISCVGYSSMQLSDVVVSTGRPTQVAASLTEEFIQGSEVVVTGTLFQTLKEVTTSLHALNYEEIRRQPGALGDVHRIIQSMPGVVPTNDQRNDLVVRGGSPGENLTMIDNIEVPNLSHFGAQGASGGPISMLNTELIREASFLAGGFPAQYGGKLSSVLNVSLRDGNRDDIAGDADLSFAGAGAVLEGPIGGRGAFIVSARRSFLDLVIGNYGMTAVPKYSNYQAKASYDLDASNKLWFVSLGGIDNIQFDYDPSKTDDPNSLVIHSGGWRTISGVNWQTLWGRGGYGILSLSDALDVFNQEAWDVTGVKTQTFRNHSREGQTTAKYDAVVQIEKMGQLTFGIAGRALRNDLEVAQPVGVKNIWDGASARVDTFNINRGRTYGQFSSYAQWTGPLFAGLDLSIGLRYDHFGYDPSASTLTPRIGAAYALVSGLSLDASYGVFTQAPPSVYVEAIPENRSLRPLRAQHLIAGVTWFPRDDVKITLEGYYKRYTDYPVSAAHPTFSLANAGDEYSVGGFLFPLTSAGEGNVRGIEFYFQKKLTDQWYGQAGYSYSQARHQALDGVLRPGAFDIPHVLSLVGGYRLSSAWEFSSKFTYASGRPFTPLDLAASSSANRLVYDFSRTNAGRLPDYHRLDLRMDYRAHFSGWNLVTYMELQNVYNRENVFMYTWNEKTGQQVIVKQIAFFPVGGIKAEF